MGTIARFKKKGRDSSKEIEIGVTVGKTLWIRLSERNGFTNTDIHLRKKGARKLYEFLKQHYEEK